MALLAPADQEKLRASFDEMTSPVRLLFFTQTLDCDTCVQTRQILDELPPLSDKITVEEVNFVLEKDKAAQYGIDRVPAISLVQAVLLVGGRASSLTAENLARVAAVDKAMTIKVFTTPT